MAELALPALDVWPMAIGETEVEPCSAAVRLWRRGIEPIELDLPAIRLLAEEASCDWTQAVLEAAAEEAERQDEVLSALLVGAPA